MSPVTSSFTGTQSLPLHVRILRISVVSALIVLGLYATSIAWQQFGPQRSRGARPAGPIAANKGAAQKTASVDPAKSPTTKTTEATNAVVTTPAHQPGAIVTTRDAVPRDNVPQTDVATSSSPTPTADSVPTPKAALADTSTTALPPGTSVAPVLASAVAKVWWQSRNSIKDGAGRAAQAIGQLTLESFKDPGPATQPPEETSQATASAPPSEVATTPDTTPEVKTARSTRVLLVNPTETGGVIHYLVNGATYSLYPGQTHQLDGGQSLRLEFHRGGSFGDSRQNLTPGRYEFQVAADGWKLVEQTDDDQM